jgi:hypothetical protein
MQQSVAAISPAQHAPKVPAPTSMPPTPPPHHFARSRIDSRQAEYVRIVLSIVRRLPQPSRVLVIGLGGGVM